MDDLLLFVASRADGRSDRRVVIEFVENKGPGDILSYDDLQKVLQVGLIEREVTRRIIGQAVRAANPLLLEEQKRVLMTVRGVGYKVAHAIDHRDIALGRRARADNQMRMAVHTLQHVRWDEMEPAAREAGRATLTIMVGLWQAVDSVSRRQDKMEKVIQQLIQGA